jgi:hypothetical protein
MTALSKLEVVKRPRVNQVPRPGNKKSRAPGIIVTAGFGHVLKNLCDELPRNANEANVLEVDVEVLIPFREP